MLATHSDQTINEIISMNLLKITKSSDFDFVWYKNPKPSITNFFHVQVFWITYIRA